MKTLATSAGKTHTLSRYVIPDAMSNGLADIVIFTTPNPASMGEVVEALKESVPTGVEVVCEPGKCSYSTCTISDCITQLGSQQTKMLS